MPEDTARPAYRFIAENWQTSTRSPVFHVTHPERDAWCGRRWTDSSFIGVANTRARRCRRCQALGEGA